MKSLAGKFFTSSSKASDRSGPMLYFFYLIGTLEGSMLSARHAIFEEMPIISARVQGNTSKFLRKKSINRDSTDSNWEPIFSILSGSCLSTIICSIASVGSTAASSSLSLGSGSLKGSPVYLRGGAFFSCYASEFLMQREASTPLPFSLFRFSQSSVT